MIQRSYLHSYTKRFSFHGGAIVTIYGDTLTIPKPFFDIDSKKEPLTLDGFETEKPSFGRIEQQDAKKIPMDFAPYNNNIVGAMIRRMYYLPGMNLGKTMKEATA